MKKPFRTIVFSILVMVLLLFATSCKDSNRVKVGLLTDITGRSSQIGIAGRNALEIAVDEYNKGNHTYNIELIIKDDKGSRDDLKKVMKEFEQEDVHFIIGPYTSNIAIEIVSLNMNNNENMLILSPTVSTDTVINVDD